MILVPNMPTKMFMPNPTRQFLGFQNMDPTLTNIVYILPYEATDAETYINNGFCLGGYGILEIPSCNSIRGHGAWYAYTTVAGGIDLRVLEV